MVQFHQQSNQLQLNIQIFILKDTFEETTEIKISTVMAVDNLPSELQGLKQGIWKRDCKWSFHLSGDR